LDKDKKSRRHRRHQSLLFFAEFSDEQLEQLWRDHFRQLARTARDNEDVTNLMSSLKASAACMRAATRSRNTVAIYAALIAHVNTLGEAARMELRMKNAAGFIIEEVADKFAEAFERKRKQNFDFKKLVDKLSRLTKPKLGHQQSQRYNTGNQFFRGGRSRGHRGRGSSFGAPPQYGPSGSTAQFHQYGRGGQ
jgi:hypothetical protein